jgi:hypothetical protein
LPFIPIGETIRASREADKSGSDCGLVIEFGDCLGFGGFEGRFETEPDIRSPCLVHSEECAL